MALIFFCGVFTLSFAEADTETDNKWLVLDSAEVVTLHRDKHQQIPIGFCVTASYRYHGLHGTLIASFIVILKTIQYIYAALMKQQKISRKNFAFAFSFAQCEQPYAVHYRFRNFSV